MRRDPETRIMYAARKEIQEIGCFIKEEQQMAINLLDWCRAAHFDLPDDEYRAVAFIRNEEYERKRGSLALLYQTRKRLMKELPPTTVETAIPQTRYRFKVYCAVLAAGGYA